MGRPRKELKLGEKPTYKVGDPVKVDFLGNVRNGVIVEGPYLYEEHWYYATDVLSVGKKGDSNPRTIRFSKTGVYGNDPFANIVTEDNN